MSVGLRRRVGHRIEYGLVLLARSLDRILGPRLSSALAAGLGRLAYRPLGIRRALVEDHLRRSFPGRDEAWVRRTAGAAYAHLGREGMTMLRLSRLGRDDVMAATRVDGIDGLRRAAESGAGAVLVSGHLGNWEVGGAALAARGIPLDVVAQRQANPLFDRLLNSARERLGMRVIERSRATRESLRSLRAGRVVVLMADQDGRGSGIFVQYMGRPASTHRGPAVLALRSGAPVFIGTATRAPDGRYDVAVEPIAVPPSADAEDQVRLLTQAHAAALEARVRREPGQYFWHHRRWKTEPPAGTETGSQR